MNAADRLDQIQARADAATPGPWVIEDENVVVAHMDDDTDERWVADVWPIADRVFIAAVREDVPALVAALRAVLTVVDRMEKVQELHGPTAAFVLRQDMESALGGAL